MSNCPKCKSFDNIVKDSRVISYAHNLTVRRRRLCVCGHKYVTFELTENQIDGHTEAFRILKLLKTQVNKIL